MGRFFVHLHKNITISIWLRGVALTIYIQNTLKFRLSVKYDFKFLMKSQDQSKAYSSVNVGN